jgi:hypothetical protein
MKDKGFLEKFKELDNLYKEDGRLWGLMLTKFNAYLDITVTNLSCLDNKSLFNTKH